MKLYLLLTSYLSIFALLVYRGFINLDPDLGWHLESGRTILLNWQWFTPQTYLWTIPNIAWINHEWLIDTFSYLIFNYGGHNLLVIFFAILGLTALILANYHQPFSYWRLSANSLVVMALWAHFGTRPQIISFIALILLFIINRPTVPKFWLPILFWLWASMHAGFLFGLIVLFVITVDKLITAYRQQTIQQTFWSISLWPLIAFAVTWITPYGYKLYSFLFAYRQVNFTPYISEWRPLYEPPINDWQIALLSFTVASLIFIYLQKIKTTLWTKLLIIISIIMAISSIRHVAVLSAVYLMLILPLLEKTTLPKFPSKTIAKISLIILILFSTQILLLSNWHNDPFVNNCQNYPCQTITYLKTHPELLQKRLLNHFNFAGYLIWRLPEARLYIDGRLPQILYHGQPLIVDFQEFLNAKTLSQKLQQENIELVWWLKKSPIGSLANKKSPLLTYLQNNSNWQLLAEDEVSVIYLKIKN